MARGKPHITDEELIAAFGRLWSQAPIQRVKGDMLVNHPDDYATVSWGLSERSARRVTEGRRP